MIDNRQWALEDYFQYAVKRNFLILHFRTRKYRKKNSKKGMLSYLSLPFILILGSGFCVWGQGPDPWNQFRGPNGSGIRADASIGVPSVDDLLWKTPLPFGLSCPVLSEDKIFLTGMENKSLLTIALDKESGKILWKKKAPKTEIEKFHPSSSPVTPTPFVDGKRLYVYFGSYGLICYDHQGLEIWKKPLP
ncbi:MAG: hypothetical protein CBC16_01160, partial [Verrucomicrobia bacterium TMED56]